MNDDQKTHLDDEILRELIQGLQPSDLENAQRQHLDTCPDCQKRLELLAADSWWWDSCRPLIESRNSFESEDRPSTFPSRENSTVENAPSVAVESNANPSASFPPKAQPSIPRSSQPELLGRLDQYEIESLIGTGGMGVVYKGFDTELHRPVAIKMLLPHLANHPGVRKQFLREARSAAAITHEHVIDIFQVNASAENPYLVMSYVPGDTLEDAVNRDGALSCIEVIRYSLQIASALSEAHRQGVVHRDIKPANVLLRTGGEKVVITDFGLAKTMDEASMTRTGLITGTPIYMSPEQCQGKSFTERSDLFSLGGVMYFLATGMAPFAAQNPLAVMHQICHTPVQDVRHVGEEVSTPLAVVIHRLLEINPADRFRSAEEAADVLRALLAHYMQPESNSLPRVRPPKSWNSGFFRRPSIVEALIIATATVCIGVKTAMSLW